MSDHFYSIAAKGFANRRNPSDITVATAAQAANPLEVRITDGALSKRDVYDFLEYISDLLAAMDSQVIAQGTLISDQT